MDGHAPPWLLDRAAERQPRLRGYLADTCQMAGFLERLGHHGAERLSRRSAPEHPRRAPPASAGNAVIRPEHRRTASYISAARPFLYGDGRRYLPVRAGVGLG